MVRRDILDDNSKPASQPGQTEVRIMNMGGRLIQPMPKPEPAPADAAARGVLAETLRKLAKEYEWPYRHMPRNDISAAD